MPADKPGAEYSFAIGSKFGHQSAKWQIIVRGMDVYVNTAAQSKIWHASLHEGGQWHIKETAGDRSRILVQTHESLVPSSSYAVGLFIGIPDSCLRPASDVAKASDPNIWFDRPPHGGAVEIAVIHWDHTGFWEDWPGKSEGTQLRWVYKSGETTALLLLVRVLAAEHPIVIQGEQLRPKDKPIVLDSPERRPLWFGTTPTGSLVIWEYAID